MLLRISLQVAFGGEAHRAKIINALSVSNLEELNLAASSHRLCSEPDELAGRAKKKSN